MDPRPGAGRRQGLLLQPPLGCAGGRAPTGEGAKRWPEAHAQVSEGPVELAAVVVPLAPRSTGVAERRDTAGRPGAGGRDATFGSPVPTGGPDRDLRIVAVG